MFVIITIGTNLVYGDCTDSLYKNDGSTSGAARGKLVRPPTGGRVRLGRYTETGVWNGGNPEAFVSCSALITR